MNKQILSTRYSVHVIILLLLALIPTLLHSYIGAKVEDGNSVKKIPITLDKFTSVAAKRNNQWGKDIFDSDDWFERNYSDTRRNNVRLFVARSYDHKRLYHHPELALSYGQNLSQKMNAILPDHAEIPLHILTNNDNSMFVAYALLYDTDFIKNPIMHQLSDSLRILVSARKTMTLFYVSESRPANNQIPLDQSAAISLLTSAIQSFRLKTDTTNSD